jgi:digeranylgeranylglycerophospholipid reductase
LEVDVLIVGAGPAGSTTARYCAGKDSRVLLIDRRREIGYPVQCGEFLPAPKEMYSMFPRTMDLEELFRIDSEHVKGVSEFVDMVSPRGRRYRCSFEGMTLDRRQFDKHLVKLATERGAEVRTETAFLSMKDGLAQTTMGEIRAKVIVGADGPKSRTARAAGLKGPDMCYPAITGQAEGDFEPAIKMYFGSIAPGGYAWIIPKKDSANVGLGVDPRLHKGSLRPLFDRFLASRLLSAKDVTMGFVPQSGPVSRTVAGKVMLVGDAAGHVMATNGGGIPLAMVAGRIAGQAIGAHLKDGAPLELYERKWRHVLGKPLDISLWTRKLGDMFFPSDRRMEFAMMALGERGLERAIRCSRVFYFL